MVVTAARKVSKAMMVEMVRAVQEATLKEVQAVWADPQGTLTEVQAVQEVKQAQPERQAKSSPLTVKMGRPQGSVFKEETAAVVPLLTCPLSNPKKITSKLARVNQKDIPATVCALVWPPVGALAKPILVKRIIIDNDMIITEN